MSVLKERIKTISQANDTFMTGTAILDSELLMNGYYYYTVKLKQSGSTLTLVKVDKPDVKLSSPVNAVEVSIKKVNDTYTIVTQTDVDAGDIYSGKEYFGRGSGNGAISDAERARVEEAVAQQVNDAYKAIEEAKKALDYKIEDIKDPAGELRTAISNDIDALKQELNAGFDAINSDIDLINDPTGPIRKEVNDAITDLQKQLNDPTNTNSIQAQLDATKERLRVSLSGIETITDPAGPVKQAIESKIAAIKDAIEKDGSVLDNRFDGIIATTNQEVSNITAPNTGLIAVAKKDLTQLMDSKDSGLKTTIESADGILQQAMDSKDSTLKTTIESSDGVLQRAMATKDQALKTAIEDANGVLAQMMDSKDTTLRTTINNIDIKPIKDKADQLFVDVNTATTGIKDKLAKASSDITSLETNKAAVTRVNSLEQVLGGTAGSVGSGGIVGKISSVEGVLSTNGINGASNISGRVNTIESSLNVNTPNSIAAKLDTVEKTYVNQTQHKAATDRITVAESQVRAALSKIEMFDFEAGYAGWQSDYIGDPTLITDEPMNANTSIVTTPGGKVLRTTNTLYAARRNVYKLIKDKAFVIKSRYRVSALTGTTSMFLIGFAILDSNFNWAITNQPTVWYPYSNILNATSDWIDVSISCTANSLIDFVKNSGKAFNEPVYVRPVVIMSHPNGTSSVSTTDLLYLSIEDATDMVNTRARISTLETTVGTPTSGLVQKVSSLDTSINTPSTGLASRIGNVETSKADLTALTAESIRIDALEATVSENNVETTAKIGTIATALSDADSALSERIDTIETNYVRDDAQINAAIRDEAKARSDADGALASRTSNLEAAVGNIDGSGLTSKITNLEKTYVDKNTHSAVATRVGSLEVISKNKDNLVINGNLTDTEMFFSGGLESQVERVINTDSRVPANAPTKYVLRTNSRDTVINKQVPVDSAPGDTFYTSAMVANTSDTTHAINLMFVPLTADNAVIEYKSVTTRQFNNATGTWTKIEANYTTPANTAKLRLFLQQDRSTTNTVVTDSWYITNVELRNTNALKQTTSKLTTLENVVGTPTSGLVQRVNSLDTSINTPTVGLNARIGNVETSKADLTALNTQTQRINTLESDVNTGTNSIKSRVGTLESTVSTGSNALATRVSTLETDINTANTGVKAKISSLENTVSNPTSGLVNKVNTLDTSINTPNTGLAARIGKVETGKVDTTTMTAESRRIDDLQATVSTGPNNLSGRIGSLESVTVSGTNALVTRVGTLESDITTGPNNLKGKISTLENIVSNGSESLVTKVSGLQASTSAAATKLSKVDGVDSWKYTVHARGSHPVQYPPTLSEWSKLPAPISSGVVAHASMNYSMFSNENTIFRYTTGVFVTIPKTIAFTIIADDGVRVYANNKEVYFRANYSTGATPTINIPLLAGWNTLDIIVGNGGGVGGVGSFTPNLPTLVEYISASEAVDYAPVMLTDAKITEEATARSSETSALGNRTNAIETALGNVAGGGLTAKVNTIEGAYVDKTTHNAVASRVGTLESTVNTPGSGITARLNTVEATVGTPTSGLVQKVNTLDTQINQAGTGLSAKIGSLESSKVDLNTYNATANKVSTLDTEVNRAGSGILARLTTNENAVSTANTSNASKFSSLEARIQSNDIDGRYDFHQDIGIWATAFADVTNSLPTNMNSFEIQSDAHGKFLTSKTSDIVLSLRRHFKAIPGSTYTIKTSVKRNTCEPGKESVMTVGIYCLDKNNRDIGGWSPYSLKHDHNYSNTNWMDLTVQLDVDALLKAYPTAVYLIPFLWLGRVDNAANKNENNRVSARYIDIRQDTIPKRNIWSFRKYPSLSDYSINNLDQTVPTAYSLVNDGTNLVKDVGDSYIGRLTTKVYNSVGKTISFTATHDDGGAIYVNGNLVYNVNAFTGNASISFNIEAGWSTIEMVWQEGSGGDGWFNISNPISNQVEMMMLNNNATTSKITEISTVAVDAQGKANAIRGIELDVNGKISGYKSTNNGVTSNFIVNADNFKVYNAAGGDQAVFAVGTVGGVNKLGLRGDMIIDGSITADSLVANSVTATKIAAGAITTNHMNAGSIDADRLVARSISADKIKSKSITVNEIQANAITADVIAAGAITADKLAIGSNRNLIPNTEFPAFSLEGWNQFHDLQTPLTYFGALGINNWSSGYYRSGKGVYIHSDNSNTGEFSMWYSRLPIDASNQTYILSAYVSAHRVTPYVKVEWYSSAGALLRADTVRGINDNQSIDRIYVKTTAPVGSSLVTVVVGAINTARTSNDLTLFVSDIMFEKAASGQLEPSPYSPSGSTLIDAGTIKTGLIGANVIDAGLIRSKLIDADLINAGDIIAGGSITAAQVDTKNVRLTMFNGDGKISETDIKPGHITTNLIAADAITTDKIKAGAIYADKIAAEQIVGTHIQALAISANHIQANTLDARVINTTNVRAAMFNGDGKLIETDIKPGQITTQLISANAITSDKIKAGAITADKLSVGNGSNLLTTTEFVNGMDASVHRWGVAGLAASAYSVEAVGVNHWASNFVKGTGIRLAAKPETDSFYWFCGENIAISPWTTYMFSAILAQHRVNAKVGIDWLDANKNLVSSNWDSPGSTSTTQFWSINENFSNRLYIKGIPPQGAVYARPMIFVYKAAPTTEDLVIYLSQPMFESVKGDATLPSLYSVGGSTSIEGSLIKTGTIQANSIASKSITSNQIASKSITANELTIINEVNGKLEGSYIDRNGIFTTGRVTAQAGFAIESGGRTVFGIDYNGNGSFDGDVKARRFLLNAEDGSSVPLNQVYHWEVANLGNQLNTITNYFTIPRYRNSKGEYKILAIVNFGFNLEILATGGYYYYNNFIVDCAIDYIKRGTVTSGFYKDMGRVGAAGSVIVELDSSYARTVPITLTPSIRAVSNGYANRNLQSLHAYVVLLPS